MTTDRRVNYIQRFANATNAAREHGEVRGASPNHRVFLFAPVTLDTIQWVSERDGMEAVSDAVQLDGRYWMTVMIP